MVARLLRAGSLAAVLLAAAAQEAGTPPPAPAPAPAPDEPRPPLSTFWDGALVDGRNGTDFDEPAGYRKLLLTLRDLDPAQAAREPVRFDRAAVMADPDRYRGDWVELRGEIGDLWAVRLGQPLSGSEDAWRGIVADTSGSDAVFFDVLERPGELELRRDLVDLEGVFYRTVSYENRDGKILEVPWILARSVTRVDQAGLPRSTGFSSPWALVLIVLALVFVAVRFGSNLRRWKRDNTRPANGASSSIRRAAFGADKRPPESRHPDAGNPPTASPPGSP